MKNSQSSIRQEKKSPLPARIFISLACLLGLSLLFFLQNSEKSPPQSVNENEKKLDAQSDTAQKNLQKKPLKQISLHIPPPKWTPSSEENKTNKENRENKETKADKETPREKEKSPPKKGRNHMLPPLKAMITSPFGERRGALGNRIHSGLDIRAHLGWPVIAFADGIVRKAGFYGRAGIMVEILHSDGSSSRYAHLQTTTVKENEHVKKGEQIGEVGCTGYTTGAHLHFALYSENQEPVDPAKHLHSAYDILRPDPETIPEKLGPQQCNGHFSPYTPVFVNRNRRKGPVVRSRSGKPMRIDLNALRNYRPPEIPLWNSRLRHNR